MNTRTKGALVFAAVLLLAFMIGSYILTATFFGVVMLIGLVFLVESIKPLKWLMSKSTRIVDSCIFLFTIVAMASYGLNITAALTVAGLGYTLVYAPYLREQYSDQSNKDDLSKARHNASKVDRS